MSYIQPFDNTTSIQPFDKTITKTVVSFTLNITSMIFNTSATFRVYLYDANNKIVETTNVIVEGEEYLNWNNDDNYIIQLVAIKLGFVIS
jgi:hypothetical protein